MKKNRNGFMLAETIAISAVVLGALVLIYTQFATINRSYNNSFKYNNVDKLYAVNNISEYITSDGIENIEANLVNQNYVDITSCSTNYFVEFNYCEVLFKNLNVKTVLYTDNDMIDIKQDDLNNYSQELKNFINYYEADSDDMGRLIVEFNDDTFATLKVKRGV